MLARFCLYGFLKNQQYYEPFLILAFREKGLTFFVIGLLVGFRELCVNILEVPTGAIADLYGRRRAMVLSFIAYILSFLIFAVSDVIWHLFTAMLFFAVGEAFRTGTHKAMILDWLRLQGRESEKTQTYGVTRSWAKIGSAVSVIIATGLVFFTGRYSAIFWLAIIPYCAAIVNFVGYPRELDGRPERTPSIRNAVAHLAAALRGATMKPRVRRVLAESMGYESIGKVISDYLQPVIKQFALGAPLLFALSEDRRTAIMVGCVYFLVYVASSVAARRSHRIVKRMGDEGTAARRMWWMTFAIYAAMAVALLSRVVWPAVGLFVLLELVRNTWRPIAITRIDNETDAGSGATMLSIDSQAKALGTMILAPIVGFGVDRLAFSADRPAFWVVAAAAAVIAAIGSALPAMSPPTPSDRSQTTALRR